MKKILKVVGGIFLGFIVLSVIGAVLGGGKNTKPASTASNTNNQGSAQVQPTPKIATKTSAKVIIADFDKNKLSATDQHKGKYYEFTAKIKNISEDITGSPYLSLEPTNVDKYYFGTTLQCLFKNVDPLKSLANGQDVTLRGTNDGMGLGIVTFKDCEVVQ